LAVCLARAHLYSYITVTHQGLSYTLLHLRSLPVLGTYKPHAPTSSASLSTTPSTSPPRILQQLPKMSSTGNDQGNDSQKGSKPNTPKGKDKVSSKESTPKGDGSVGGYHRPPHDIPSMFPEDPVDYDEALGGYIDRQRREHGTTGPSARGPTPAGGPGPVVRKETHSTTSATSMLTCGPASNLPQQTQAGLNYWRGMWAINFTSPKASMLTYLVPRTQAEMDAFSSRTREVRQLSRISR
jgi:hypothetical protein